MKGSENIITEEELFAAIAASIDEGLKAETEAECNDDDDNTYDDYVSEDDIARENGFWVDEDGHWRELDEDNDW